MGNCFSDPSPKGGQRLGGADSRPSGPTSGAVGSVGGATAKVSGSGAGRTGAPPRTLGAGGEAESGDPRDRARRAAEERAKTVSGAWGVGSGARRGVQPRRDCVAALLRCRVVALQSCRVRSCPVCFAVTSVPC
jgi:hypothetical protein